MSEIEIAILIALYSEPGYTKVLDYGQPIVQGLLAREYIYMGGQQMIAANILTREMPAKFTLQPFVYRTFNHYRPKMEKKITKIEKKLSKTGDTRAKEKLQEELNDLRDKHHLLYEGGLNNG